MTQFIVPFILATALIVAWHMFFKRDKYFFSITIVHGSNEGEPRYHTTVGLCTIRPWVKAGHIYTSALKKAEDEITGESLAVINYYCKRH